MGMKGISSITLSARAFFPRHHHVTKRTLAAILNCSSVILIRPLMVVVGY